MESIVSPLTEYPVFIILALYQSHKASEDDRQSKVSQHCKMTLATGSGKVPQTAGRSGVMAVAFFHGGLMACILDFSSVIALLNFMAANKNARSEQFFRLSWSRKVQVMGFGKTVMLLLNYIATVSTEIEACALCQPLCALLGNKSLQSCEQRCRSMRLCELHHC